MTEQQIDRAAKFAAKLGIDAKTAEKMVLMIDDGSPKGAQFSTPSSGSTIRHDLHTVVMEATGDMRLIADDVLPEFPSDVKAGTYPKLTVADARLLDAEITQRQADGTYGRIKRQWTTDNFETKDYGLEEPVPDDNRKDVARFFDDEVIAATLTMRNVRLARERRAATALFANDDTFAAGFHKTAATVAYTAATLADGTLDVVADIYKAIDTLELRGYEPTHVVIPSQVWLRAKRSTKLQNFLRGAKVQAASASGPGVEMNISIDDFAKAFDLQGGFIGRGVYNSAETGKAFVPSRAWPNTYIWVGVIKSGDPRNGGAGRTINWTGSSPSLYVTETYRDETRRSDIVRVRHHVVEKLTDTLCGELITTSYA